MSNPSVVATISANDLASPKLRELMATLKQANSLAKDLSDGKFGNAYASQFHNANVAAQKHVGILHQMHKAHLAIGSTIAGYTALRVAHAGADAVKDSLPFLRKDREISARSGYSSIEMELLRKQQRDLATQLGSTNEATQKAQEKFAQLGYKSGTNVALTRGTAIGARAMGVDAASNAELMETLLSQFGIHADEVPDAVREIRRLNDIAATATKKSNMTHEDVAQFFKFSGAAAKAIGISPEQSAAVAMAGRRAGIRGDEQGVFMREFASKMASPTRGGREALAQAGINIDEYAKHGTLGGEGISKKFQRVFGKALSAKAQAQLDKEIEDKGADILTDRGKFAEAVIRARETDSGKKLSEVDRKAAVRAANEYFQHTLSGIDGAALMDKIIKTGNPMLMNNFLGSKQGARGAALVNDNGRYYFKAKDDQAHGEGYAQRISDELGKGLPAAVDALTATLESARNTLVQANEGWITGLVQSATTVTAAFSALSPEVQKSVGIFAGVATVAAGGGAMVAFGLSLRSLVVSANAASVALTTLAARGGVMVPGGASPAGNAAKALGWRAGAGALGAIAAGPIGVLAGVTAAEFAWPYVEAWANADDGIVDGSAADIARRRRFAFGPNFGSRSDAINRVILGRETSRNLAGTQPGTGGWQDSAGFGVIAPSRGWGDGRTSSIAEVTGTVTGSAEVHQMIQLEVKPTAYFESLVRRAESVSNMSLNGRLGTSMQGPGDNGTKPSLGTQ